jgi:hypothetical protein
MSCDSLTVCSLFSATAWKERRPDINPDFLGVYPWDWVRDDVANFKAISGGLLVAPILQTLILNRSPVETLDFADQVAKWPIERIIPGHLKVVYTVIVLYGIINLITLSHRVSSR